MNITKERLKETYSAMSSEKLLALRARGTLTDEANQALEEILNQREVPIAFRDAVHESAIQQFKEEERRAGLVASSSARIIGQIIDASVALALLAAGFALALVVSRSKGSERAVESVIAIFGIAALAYWLLADGLTAGQSLGKRVLGTSVVDISSFTPCSYAQSIVRNLVPLFIGPLDLLTAIGVKRQRVGDMLARTMVINGTVQRPNTPTHAIASEDATSGW